MISRSDFADWLSPMLVKELRQGMRSKVFMSAFYLTQLLMILSVVFNLAAAAAMDSDNNLMEFLNGLFWFMISVPLLLVMPVRGFGALHGEMKARTLELVFLTKLSAWRIAAGKWTALVVQTLLLLCAVMPYVVLRYFLGGVDLIEDAQSVFFLFVASAALTALTIAMSPFESKLLRVLFIVGLIGLLQFLPWLLMLWMTMSRISGTTGASAMAWQIYLCLAAYVPAFIVLAIEVAASRIAPAAENHALRKRLLGLYFLLIPLPLAWTGLDLRGLYGASMIFLFVVVLDALAEPFQPVKSLYRPFVKFKGAGGLLAALLTPGWPTATVYALGLGLLGTALSFLFIRESPGTTLSWLSYFGALVFPAALIRAFLPASRHFLGLYIALQFFFGALSILVAIMSGISQSELIPWTAPLPPCTFYFNLFGQVKHEQTGEFLLATGLVTLFSLLALMLRSVKSWREIRDLFRQARLPNSVS